MLIYYFTRRFLISFLRVFAIILALIYLIDFLEGISRSQRTGLSFTEVARISALKTPSILDEALSLIVMLAALAFSIGLARAQEFNIARSSGLSALKFLSGAGVAAFVLGIASFVFFQPIAENLLLQSKDFQSGGRTTSTLTVSDTGFWIREQSGESFIIGHANAAEQGGRVLRGVSVIRYDSEGIAASRHFSHLGFLREGQLILQDTTVWNLQDTSIDARAEKVGTQRFETTISPAQILDGLPSPHSLPVWSLPAYIGQMRASGLSPLPYQMHLHGALARPLFFVAMFLIGVIFTLKDARIGNARLAVFYATCAGFAFYFLQKFSITLGESEQIPVIIATWFPALSGCFMTLAVLLHFEDG